MMTNGVAAGGVVAGGEPIVAVAAGLAASHRAAMASGELAVLEQWHREHSGATIAIGKTFVGTYTIASQRDADALAGMRVIGQVIVAASNVSLHDFEVQARPGLGAVTILVQLVKGVDNVTISDFTVDGMNEKLSQGIGGTAYSENITIARGEVVHCGYDGIRTFSDSSYEYMYVHDFRAWNEGVDGVYNSKLSQTVAPHTDGVQTLRSGNVIANSWIDNSSAANATSAIMVNSSADEAITSLTVRGNYLNGGGYVIHVHNQNADLLNPGANGYPTGLVFEDNLIGRGFRNGVWSHHDVPSSGIAETNNVWADTRAAIPAAKRVLAPGEVATVMPAAPVITEVPATAFQVAPPAADETPTTGRVAETLRADVRAAEPAIGTTLIGNSTANRLEGRGGADTLMGMAGDDVLDGGGGADRMEGGAGNDIYHVDNRGDVAIEARNQGDDIVYASVGYALTGQYIETLVLTGHDAIDAVGNTKANTLRGNGAANILRGLDGDDTLDGGGAADRMEGGAGNDIYHVDAVGDVVIEVRDQGDDIVYASVGYALTGQYIETLVLTGHAAISATGNTKANTLRGNDAANILKGLDGDDVLDGGAGGDWMEGGVGDDIYHVDQTGDLAVEARDQGDDVVFASVSYALTGQYIETLVLTGTEAIGATGNTKANTLRGNDAANLLKGLDGNDMLDGGRGADQMEGGMGDDIYHVDAVGDLAIELRDQGNDTVHASVSYALTGQYIETLILGGSAAIDAIGNTKANILRGNAAANRLTGLDGDDRLHGEGGDDALFGGDGNDALEGGAGSDRLTGGKGGDVFVYGAGAMSLPNSADQILDFNTAQGDRIDLSGMDANTRLAGDQAFTFVGAPPRSGVAGALWVAGSSTHWQVMGDTDGDGVADLVIAVETMQASALLEGGFVL